LRLLSFLVGLSLIVVLAVFSVLNRDSVALNLWPLREAVELPLFAVVLAGTGAGLLVGAAIGWLSAGSTRRRLREERARTRALEARLADMARQQAAATAPPAEPRHEGRWLRVAGGRS